MHAHCRHLFLKPLLLTFIVSFSFYSSAKADKIITIKELGLVRPKETISFFVSTPKELQEGKLRSITPECGCLSVKEELNSGDHSLKEIRGVLNISSQEGLVQKKIVCSYGEQNTWVIILKGFCILEKGFTLESDAIYFPSQASNASVLAFSRKTVLERLALKNSSIMLELGNLVESKEIPGLFVRKLTFIRKPGASVENNVPERLSISSGDFFKDVVLLK